MKSRPETFVKSMGNSMKKFIRDKGKSRIVAIRLLRINQNFSGFTRTEGPMVLER